MTATETTVGALAAEYPAAIPLFERYGIDYCCGGSRPLEEACAGSGIEAGRLIGEIETARRAAPDGVADWTRAPLAELVGHIVEKHHSYLTAELPLLEQMLADVIEAHQFHHATTLLPLRRVFQHMKQELEMHMRKEEMILFPAIIGVEQARMAGAEPPRMPFGTVNHPIQMMEQEHENAGWALQEMREITRGFAAPGDACTKFRMLYQRLEILERDLHQHIHLENNILFPRAAELESGRAR